MIDNSSIPSIHSSKYLGMILDDKLNFKSHISNMETKLSRAVGILSKVRYIFPHSTLLLLYFALVHPHILYGLPLWGSTFPSYLTKLQRLQNKAIRIISNSKPTASVTPLYLKLGILKISDLYTLETAKIMHQHAKQNILPRTFSMYFNPLTNIHSRQTRSKTNQNFYVPKFSTNRCQKSFKFQGTKVWNSFPSELRYQPFSKFKINLKKLLLQSYL